MIYPCLGCGDLLLLKMIYEHNKLREDLCVNWEIIRRWRNNDRKYEAFVRQMLHHLLPEIRVHYVQQVTCKWDFLPHTYALGNVSLSKYFDVAPVYDFKYIVIQTKCRADQGGFMKRHGPALRQFFSSWLSAFPIVVLGEKAIGINTEIARIEVFSLYADIMLLGKQKQNQNQIIDLTVTELTNSPDFELYQRDVRILHNAETIIGFGVGGNMIMSAAFGTAMEHFLGEYVTTTATRIVERLCAGLCLEKKNAPESFRKSLHTKLPVFFEAIQNGYGKKESMKTLEKEQEQQSQQSIKTKTVEQEQQPLQQQTTDQPSTKKEPLLNEAQQQKQQQEKEKEKIKKQLEQRYEKRKRAQKQREQAQQLIKITQDHKPLPKVVVLSSHQENVTNRQRAKAVREAREMMKINNIVDAAGQRSILAERLRLVRRSAGS